MEDSALRIWQNLLDAGCGKPLIRQFLQLGREHRRAAQYRLLRQHRASLLEALHQEQYKIDCLDFLLFTMEETDRGKQHASAERTPR